ncbi:MAG: RICIN domain-containing protein [Trebonia sp.]
MNKRSTRLIAIAAAAAALPLTVLGATAAPALAAGPNDSTPAPVINLATRQCLTAFSLFDPARTAPCDTSGDLQPAQQWTFTDYGAISNPETSGCLTPTGSGTVVVLPCGGGGSVQQWAPDPQNPRMIMNRVTGECLISDFGGRVGTAPCNGHPFQNWLWANLPS